MPTTSAPVARAVDALLEATVVLSFSRVGFAVRSHLEDWPTHLVAPTAPGTGRRVLVTGGSSGLGYAAARELLAAGAHVLLTVRSTAKADTTRRRLTRELGQDAVARLAIDVLELEDLASVRSFAARRLAEPDPIDVLVNNAGALFDRHALTADGFERTYQVHVVAPFLLTALLLPRIVSGDPGRVITVTSGGMYAQRLVTDELELPADGYRGALAYARAKRAQVELTHAWARRFGDRGLDVHAVHPGWALTPGVASSLPRFRRLAGPILRDADQGADTILHLALADDLGGGGRLWHDRRPRGEHRLPWTVPARGERRRLWDRLCRDAGIVPQL